MSEMLNIYIKKFFIAAMAPSMRSPSGITGWFARRLMRSANPESTRYAFRHRLNNNNLESSSSGGVFVELGAGEGSGLLALTEHEDPSRIPSAIHLVEISDVMRAELERVVREDLPESVRASDTLIEVHGEDCRSMPYLGDDSVDTVFAMNVVYFLDPLRDYLGELHRVLKPGTGEIVWGCKFDKVPKDNEVFVNVREDEIVRMMEETGFEVTSEAIDVAAAMIGGAKDGECSAADKSRNTNGGAAAETLSAANDMRNYIEIRGRKIQHS